MANSIHKGTELNNVRETWEQNERNRPAGERQASDVEQDDLQKVIREEAAAYDEDNAEEKLLGGDRASVNDDE